LNLELQVIDRGNEAADPLGVQSLSRRPPSSVFSSQTRPVTLSRTQLQAVALAARALPAASSLVKLKPAWPSLSLLAVASRPNLSVLFRIAGHRAG
jgi:hypothetical protein